MKPHLNRRHILKAATGSVTRGILPSLPFAKVAKAASSIVPDIGVDWGKVAWFADSLFNGAQKLDLFWIDRLSNTEASTVLASHFHDHLANLFDLYLRFDETIMRQAQRHHYFTGRIETHKQLHRDRWTRTLNADSLFLKNDLPLTPDIILQEVMQTFRAMFDHHDKRKQDFTQDFDHACPEAMAAHGHIADSVVLKMLIQNQRFEHALPLDVFSQLTERQKVELMIGHADSYSGISWFKIPDIIKPFQVATARHKDPMIMQLVKNTHPEFETSAFRQRGLMLQAALDDFFAARQITKSLIPDGPKDVLQVTRLAAAVRGAVSKMQVSLSKSFSTLNVFSAKVAEAQSEIPSALENMPPGPSKEGVAAPSASRLSP